MFRLAMIAAVFSATLCGGTAQAQDTPPPNAAPPTEQPPGSQPQPAANAATAMIGVWELSDADRDKICRLNFRPDATAGGFKLDVDKNCAAVFPALKDIVAWAVDNYGNLSLVDDHGTAVLELTEVESGMYDGFRPGEGRYILQAAAAAPVHSADEMVGDWAIARGTGRPICMLTLANGAVGADVFALKIKPGCDALVTRFNPTSWHMDQGELVFSSPRGQSWRFEENDANTWQRLPETPDPVLLVRQ